MISASLDRASVVGRNVELRVRAVDPAAPISGLLASFGPSGGFGSSACAVSSDGRPPARAFAPGATAQIAVPQTFVRPGRHRGALRVHSGDCRGVSGGVVRPVVATATPPAARPVPLLLGAPISLDTGQGLPLPDLDSLPPIQISRSSPIDRSTARIARRCRHAGSRIRGSQRGRKRARLGVLCLINGQRRKNRRRALTADPRLRRAATSHSRRMVRRRFFSHVQPGGVDLVDRLYRVRYLPSRKWVVGENIAFGVGRGGYVTPTRVVSAWMRSAPHRAAILHPRFREAGLGIVPGAPSRGRAGVTYTTDFGFKAGGHRKKSRRRR